MGADDAEEDAALDLLESAAVVHVDAGFPDVDRALDALDPLGGIRESGSHEQPQLPAELVADLFGELLIGPVESGRPDDDHFSRSFRNASTLLETLSRFARISFPTFRSSACHFFDQNQACARSTVSTGQRRMPSSVA